MTPMRILVVEDEPKMADAIRRVLVAERYAVDVAEDGVAALALAGDQDHDVIVLDRRLPDLDGLEVLRLLRARGVSHARADADRAGLARASGGRAWTPARTTTCPSRSRSPSCWRACARSARRRARPGLGAARRRVTSCSTRSATGSSSVTLAEDLSAREYALLGYLIRQDGRVVTRQQILDAVWGAEPDVYSNVVDLYVHYLRRKLETLGRRDALRTVRGVGYALASDGGGHAG